LVAESICNGALFLGEPPEGLGTLEESGAGDPCRQIGAHDDPPMPLGQELRAGEQDRLLTQCKGNLSVGERIRAAACVAAEPGDVFLREDHRRLLSGFLATPAHLVRGEAGPGSPMATGGCC
jgi:hypothetical protein